MAICSAVLIMIVVFSIPFAMEIYVAENVTSDDWAMVLTPRRLYDNSNMNMFGCYVITGICRIINPIGTIGKFIHFIFTVGRKD